MVEINQVRDHQGFQNLSDLRTDAKINSIF